MERSIPEKQKMIDAHIIGAIEKVLKKGDRVELIPVKDGVKVMHIRREEIKHS